MDLTPSQRGLDLSERLQRFMDDHIYPNEHRYREQLLQSGARWRTPPLMQELKASAKRAGLWNLSLSDKQYGAGLSNLDYASLAEVMGRVIWAVEVFNCNPPDAGNMEILCAYGSTAQKQKWLAPLATGDVRSCFAMTEPAVASSDATNIRTNIRRDGDHYVVAGHKWFTTGAMYEPCRFMIVMGRTDPENPNKHLQQSLVIVPMDTPGVRILRPLTTFGYLDEPIGHAELSMEDVRVPLENILLGEGRGFEVAQARLGPGRIQHCMRLIGCAQRALELACLRSQTRVAFGKRLSDQGSVREDIAHSAAEIEQARLLTLRAAAQMDRVGHKEARDLLAMAKIVVPSMAGRVIDRSIQIHGGAGLTSDFFLAEAFSYARWARIADGPDQVHLAALGKQLIARHAPPAPEHA